MTKWHLFYISLIISLISWLGDDLMMTNDIYLNVITNLSSWPWRFVWPWRRPWSSMMASHQRSQLILDGSRWYPGIDVFWIILLVFRHRRHHSMTWKLVWSSSLVHGWRAGSWSGRVGGTSNSESEHTHFYVVTAWWRHHCRFVGLSLPRPPLLGCNAEMTTKEVSWVLGT